MKRAVVFIGVIFFAALLVAMIFFSVGERPANNIETASVELEYLPEFSGPQYLDEVPASKADEPQNSTSSRKYIPEDEAATRKEVREIATRYVQDVYSILIRDFDLTSSQREALTALLIEAEIEATRTFYSSGEGMDALERASRIAAIIGEQKQQVFLARELDLYEYQEIAKVQAILERNNAPLGDAKIDRLLKIFINVNQQVGGNQRETDLTLIEALQHKMKKKTNLIAWFWS